VAFIHRLGSALSAHLHFHCVVLDGVFASAPGGGVVFHPAAGIEPRPSTRCRWSCADCLLGSFVRRGLLDGDAACDMAQWQHGGGFLVDAAVRIGAADQPGRERLLRCCARPPFALDRLQQPDAEHLIYNASKAGPGWQSRADPHPAATDRPPRRPGASATRPSPPLLRRAGAQRAVARRSGAPAMK